MDSRMQKLNAALQHIQRNHTSGGVDTSSALHIGLDLGGDTLKISFACKKGDKVRYGKIAGKSKLTQVALPALAYYDTDRESWFFADQVDQQGAESFITVVKIKSLISLLTMPRVPKPVAPDGKPLSEAQKKKLKKQTDEARAVWQQNKEYYFKGHDFPKFYFPVRRELLDDFNKMVEEDMTFSAKSNTPQSVCEAFFTYIRSLVDERRAELEAAVGVKFTSYRVALVHPAKVGEDYLTELSALICKAFGAEPAKILSSNKALALYAKDRNAVQEGESFLVFDMGEESISVVQASLVDGRVVIDGVEGHSVPLDLGGNDIDEAIVRHLEGAIDGRETFGSPSAGQIGHITEGSVYAKQYQLMKDVKRAKVIFSKKGQKSAVFAKGVPITFSREVLVQRVLTENDIKACIGVRGKNGIAKKIVEYILQEVKLPINRKVTKIFVSGGLVETFSLLDFFRSELQAKGCKTPIYTFDDGVDAGDVFQVLSYEDSVFAPAVGGALVSLLDIEIPTVLSLSYGSWLGRDGLKYLNIFANRGEVIGKNGSEFLTAAFVIGRDGYGSHGVDDEEIYSTVMTQREIDEHYKKPTRKWKFTVKGELVVGEPGSVDRKAVEKDDNIALKLVSGGENGKIYLMYNGRYVYLTKGVKVSAKEGVSLDKYGNAHPVIYNSTAPTVRGRVQYYASLTNRQPLPGDEIINLNKIEIKFKGMDDFDTSIS